MRRRAFLGLLAASCGGEDVSRRSGCRANGRGRVPLGVASASIPIDLRLLGLGSDLLAYYDVRPAVSGATASMTLSSTLDANGTTPPTVTISGSLATPRQVVITYDVGGTIGTMEYRMVVDGETLFNAVSSDTGGGNCTVDIGGGNSIVFNAGTYNVDNTHWVECVTLAELTGLANASLTDTLSGVGARYEAAGLNGTTPCLRFIRNPSALANENGVPALVTGTDVQHEIWMLAETFQHITGTGASILCGFSNQTDTTKSDVSVRQCGATNVGHESRYLVRRRDSSGTPATVEVTTDLIHADLDPHVIRAVVTSSGQMHFNGMRGKASPVSLNRGVATNLNRFTVGSIKLGTSAFSTANQWLGRFSALAITRPLSDANALLVTKALAGVAA